MAQVCAIPFANCYLYFAVDVVKEITHEDKENMVNIASNWHHWIIFRTATCYYFDPTNQLFNLLCLQGDIEMAVDVAIAQDI